MSRILGSGTLQTTGEDFQVRYLTQSDVNKALSLHRITSYNVCYTKLLRVLTQSFNQMTARDQYEAASELKQLETSLEASYTLTARLANLSLLNFMR